MSSAFDSVPKLSGSCLWSHLATVQERHWGTRWPSWWTCWVPLPSSRRPHHQQICWICEHWVHAKVLLTQVSLTGSLHTGLLRGYHGGYHNHVPGWHGWKAKHQTAMMVENTSTCVPYYLKREATVFSNPAGLWLGGLCSDLVDSCLQVSQVFSEFVLFL
jgi:hypothetical protein